MILTLLILAACKTDPPPVGDDSEPDVVRESSVWEHTGVDDSGDSADDTGDPAVAVSLTVQPAELLVDVGAGFSTRAVALDSHGDRRAVTPSWTSGDPAVAEVDAEGKVTAVGVGEVVLEASWEGLAASTTLRVQDSGALRVTVIDAETGDPLPEFRVTYGEEGVDTDEAGEATLTVGLAEAADLSVFQLDSDYIPLSVLSVIPREIVIPVRRLSDEQPAPASLGGQVELSALGEAEWDELNVGLAGPSFQRGPLFFSAGDLLAEDRAVDFYGLEVSLPGNLFLQEVAPSWEAVAWEGPVGVWALAGAVPVADLGAGFEDTADALDVLLSHLDGFRYTWQGGLSANPSVPLDLVLAPEHPLEDVVLAEVPELPEGFLGNEQPLLLVLQHSDEGPVLAGLGSGLGQVAVSRVDEELLGWSEGSSLLAYAEVGGPGSGGGRSLSLAEVEDGHVTLEPWMTPPTIGPLLAAERSVGVATDERVTVVRAHVTSNDGGMRDLYLRSGARVETLPKKAPLLSLGRTTWDLRAVELSEDTYESLLVTGGLMPAHLRSEAVASSGLEAVVTGE